MSRPFTNPVDPKGVPLERVPYFLQIQPAAQVAAGAIVQVIYTVGVRDFVATKIGFTSEPVGFPASGQQFEVAIRDIGTSIDFEPHRWNITPVVGTNPGDSDCAPLDLPVEWRFFARTSIRVEFENIGALACTPTLVFIGYLDKLGR